MTLGRGRERVKINVIPQHHKTELVDSSEETDDQTSSDYSSTSEVDTEDEESEVDVSVMDILLVTPTHEPIKLSEEEIDDHLQKIKIGDVVMESEKESYLQLFRRYIHLFTFDYKEIRQVSWVEHSIELVDGAKPIKKMPYRMNPNFSNTVKEEINKLLDAGFIFAVENSEWVSPIVISIKKNGKLRICVDYMKLNKETKKDHYPLPFSDHILDEVAGQKCYSFADGYSGYN